MSNETISGKNSNSPYIKLARALVAAKLSVIHVSAQYAYVLPFIVEAESVLTGIDLNVKSVTLSRSEKESINELKDQLEKFHDGKAYNQEGACKRDHDRCDD